MSKFVKYISYFVVFVVSFVIFLYMSLPYDAIKERVIGTIEKQAGGKYFVSVDEFSPYWFTGVEISGLSLKDATSKDKEELINIDEIQGRASFFSLILGNPSVSFDIDLGDGEISGSAGQSTDFLDLDLELDDVDFKNFKLITAKTGLTISSKISGDIKLKYDKTRPIRSGGIVSLDLDNINIAETELKLGEMAMPIPDISLSKGSGSEMRLEVGKGTIDVKSFKLADGDLQITISGKIFLSNNVNNYRFNLNGTFKASEKLEKALPFLFIVEKQKDENGNFPLSITGRLAKPSIKIGTFTLPI